ncbi:MAG: carbohydrate ABC transporter permease [Christensenellales bacterium]|jgi:ABC-type glycerol-3-phosphate transport system permease component
MNNNLFQANKPLKVIAYLVLGLSAFAVAFPIYFIVITSLKSNQEFFVNLFGFPRQILIENYATAWEVGKLGKYFGNSVLVTVSSVLLTTLLSVFSGYALAKLHIPKADAIMSGLMVFNFIPGIAIYISLYAFMARIGLTGSHLTLILPYVAWQIPSSMYIMKQYFETIPTELLESGRIDGCGELQMFVRVILPLVTPALATIIVFTFIGNWGELMWASITTAANIRMMTLPVGLLNFRTEMGVQWGQYTAGVAMVTIPLMLVFAYFQKYFVAGLTNGAVKG